MTCVFFFFNDTATTEIYTLSLHDALPICPLRQEPCAAGRVAAGAGRRTGHAAGPQRRGQDHHAQVHRGRSEEHTSELQSRLHLVCRLLLEKKNIVYAIRRAVAMHTYVAD